MRAVDATIRVEVRGAGGGSFLLNIRSGRMSAGDTAAFAPFLTVVQDRAAFETLARESGDSALALLGGLSGLARRDAPHAQARREPRPAPRRRALLGDGRRRLRADHPLRPRPRARDAPNASIAVDDDAYRELRSGKLDPGAAFLNGKIKVAGDMQLAMQLALAALSAD